MRTTVEAWLGGGSAFTTGPQAEVLHDNPRRRLVRLPTSDGAFLLVKQFRLGTGRHALREALKERIGRSPAVREWRALQRLRAAGVCVPEPLALARLADGDRLLVLRYVEGRPLKDALCAPRRERRRLLSLLGTRIAELHAAGFVHGDLHHGNIVVGESGPILLDLQHARRTARRRPRLRDLAHLDHALSYFASRTDRLRTLTAALRLACPLDAAGRSLLLELAALTKARAIAHAESRTRRCLRPGRAYTRISYRSWRGLRGRDVAPSELFEALDAHAKATTAPAVVKRDERALVTAVSLGNQAVIVKEHRVRGFARAFADLLRGSAAWRAWRGGHGLLQRGIGAARPLAFFERRVFGVPTASLVVLEDLRPDWPADCPRPGADLAGVLPVLARLAARLRLQGVDHGDLKGGNVYLREGPGGALEARLIDLESVVFPWRVGERRAIRALAQLNASLPDAYPALARCAAFELYARAAPFSLGREQARSAVIAESLARGHRWTGRGCVEAEREGRVPREEGAAD
ncbi:MAG TPA: lipopolysaccharide kinase InaA family protein [Myxococcota bacterium]|nr:lipopolysaccharide kinase InaA family protein [Myxococcota bacterium]